MSFRMPFFFASKIAPSSNKPTRLKKLSIIQVKVVPLPLVISKTFQPIRPRVNRKERTFSSIFNNLHLGLHMQQIVLYFSTFGSHDFFMYRRTLIDTQIIDRWQRMPECIDIIKQTDNFLLICLSIETIRDYKRVSAS